MSASRGPIESIQQAESHLRFINPEALIAIRNLQLIAKAVVEGFISGMHCSPYHGFSVDFAEYRAYAPGDDIRTVDWKVFARSDKFFVKKFEGDTNTQVYLLLDCSKSMGFSSHSVSKLDYARFVAAAIAYLCPTPKGCGRIDDFRQEGPGLYTGSDAAGTATNLLAPPGSSGKRPTKLISLRRSLNWPITRGSATFWC